MRQPTNSRGRPQVDIPFVAIVQYFGLGYEPSTCLVTCRGYRSICESAIQRPETRYAQCGDISLAYQVIGDGPIDLLYAQGWLSNIEYAWESPEYARFLTSLSSFSRLIFFDKRGTGMSDRGVGFPTLEQRTQDIQAVLDATDSKQAALFGVSEGET